MHSTLQGYTIRGLKMMNVTKEHAERHYADLSAKPFFAGEPSFALCRALFLKPPPAGVWICGARRQ